MKIDILTLFPEMFISPLSHSILKRAQDKGLLKINLINIRDFAPGKHKQVDDYPFGGGAGMVMKPDIVIPALESCKSQDSRVIYLSPQGRPLNQQRVTELSQKEHLLLLCGHYEGIDYRVMDMVDEEISIGDYVLTGGELPAMVLVDAVSRMIPGVLGAEESSREESFANNLLEYPHYTRPRVFRGEEVPEILLSGHHEKIELWRKKQSLLTTLLKRPELLINRDYDPEEKKMLQEILFNRE